MLSISTESK